MLPRIRVQGVALAALLALLAPQAAKAGIIAPCPDYGSAFVECFDDEPSGTAASAADFAEGTIVDALILSEADASFLLGLDTEGWATSGSQGILNALVPVVEFLFDTAISLFRLEVVALPGPFGEPVPIVVQGFEGGVLRASGVSDVSRVREDGTHADVIGFQDATVAFDRVLVFAALGPCSGPDCEIGGTSAFFADTLKYLVTGPKTVPEPSAATLALASLAAFGLWLAGKTHPRKESRR